MWVAIDVAKARHDAQHEAQGCPSKGLMFPTGSRSGHLEESVAEKYHAKALKLSGVRTFEPSCLRHTVLTNLAAAGCDASTLARIAGHSSIQITMRYCHPQADTIERAFQQMANRQEVVTTGGHQVLALTGR